MALRVDAARNRQTNQVHCGVLAEHQRTDLDGADAAFDVELAGQRNAWELSWRHVWEERSRVYIDGVAPGRLNDRHALARNVIAQISGGDNAVIQVVFFQRLIQANGDGLEVSPGKAPIGGEPFGEDEEVFFLLRDGIVIGAQEAADIGKAVFFADMVQPSAWRNISRAISRGVLST